MTDTIIIRLDPRLLSHPDADIRYRLPELLVQRSEGVLTDDGYDYIGEDSLLAIFLKTAQLEVGLACVLEVIEHVRVLDRAVCKYVVALRAFTPLQTTRCFHSVSSKMVDEKAVNHFEIYPNDLQLVAVIAVEREAGFRVVYPVGFVGSFLLE